MTAKTGDPESHMENDPLSPQNAIVPLGCEREKQSSSIGSLTEGSN
jgi:hypothetical protein